MGRGGRGKRENWRFNSEAEHLPGMWEDLCSIPSTAKDGGGSGYGLISLITLPPPVLIQAYNNIDPMAYLFFLLKEIVFCHPSEVVAWAELNLRYCVLLCQAHLLRKHSKDEYLPLRSSSGM